MKSLLTRLGLDEQLDRTAKRSRKKFWLRLALSGVVALILAQFAPWQSVGLWFCLMLAAEALLTVATAPKLMATHVATVRVLRVASTGLTATLWSWGAFLSLNSGTIASTCVAVALLAGIAVYAIGSCFRSPAQLFACGVPPAISILILPSQFEMTIAERVASQAAMLVVVGFGAATAVNAVVTHRRLMMSSAAEREQRRRAASANKSKSVFLANMSHEIRTPLNGVVAMADALSRADLPAEAAAMVKIMRSSSDTLERLLSDILDAARIDAGKLEIERTTFHLGDAIESAAALFSSQAAEKGVELSVELTTDADGYFSGDPVRLRQIVSNFVSNAVKFTEFGAVVVKASMDGHRLHMAVEDTGVGFEPSKKSALFGRFQQADGTITRRFGGTGLGLAISAELAQLMGGAVDCQSTPGLGSKFWLDLPLTPAAPPVGANNDAAPLRARNDLRVLLADDHPANRKILELMLAPLGWELTNVENGAEAVSRFENGRFDIVLMDMQMPVMDGITAVRAVRQLEQRNALAPTPILMLTANALPEHVAAGQAAGANGHVTKPIRLEGLLEAVSAALAVEHDQVEKAAA